MTEALQEEIEEALGICCGNTDATRDHIRTTLRLLKARSDANQTKEPNGWENGTEALKTHLGDLYEPMAAVYLHYLDRLDLIEHGSGIAGSWLTKRGVEVLEALETISDHD